MYCLIQKLQMKKMFLYIKLIFSYLLVSFFLLFKLHIDNHLINKIINK